MSYSFVFAVYWCTTKRSLQPVLASTAIQPVARLIYGWRISPSSKWNGQSWYKYSDENIQIDFRMIWTDIREINSTGQSQIDEQMNSNCCVARSERVKSHAPHRVHDVSGKQWQSNSTPYLFCMCAHSKHIHSPTNSEAMINFNVNRRCCCSMSVWILSNHFFSFRDSSAWSFFSVVRIETREKSRKKKQSNWKRPFFGFVAWKCISSQSIVYLFISREHVQSENGFCPWNFIYFEVA